MRWPPSGYTFFPYTTLFRSYGPFAVPRPAAVPVGRRTSANAGKSRGGTHQGRTGRSAAPPAARRVDPRSPHAERSEEHTSELQSHVNLVCRLLLEKKNKHKQFHSHAVVNHLGGWRFSHPRLAQHRRNPPARLAPPQHRPSRAQRCRRSPSAPRPLL